MMIDKQETIQIEKFNTIQEANTFLIGHIIKDIQINEEGIFIIYVDQ